MLIEYIRYTVTPDRADDFAAPYRVARRALDASPHCFGYELSRGES
jgi:hypothetical protein